MILRMQRVVSQEMWKHPFLIFKDKEKQKTGVVEDASTWKDAVIFSKSCKTSWFFITFSQSTMEVFWSDFFGKYGNTHPRQRNLEVSKISNLLSI